MSPRRHRLLAAASAVLLGALTACGGADAGAAPADGTVTIGAVSNGVAQETTLTVPVVESIRATLPAEVRESGTLVVGLGLLPAGAPPLGYTGTDDRTLTGSEPDLARLIGAVLGLEVELNNATWENLFVGLDSGRTDVGFSNITVTEERKQSYDFATYRTDDLGFATRADSTWTFDGDYRALAGQRVAVGAGTNQERILLEWQARLQAEGQTLAVEYYPDNNAVYLALDSGRIDAYLGPNPSVTYQETQTAGTPSEIRTAGTYSGAGESLQGLIAATSAKGSGLAEPLAAAINHLISTGQYATWLETWNLSTEAVPTSEVNPPGLPLTNS